jgi:uncharacterized membrane protein
MRGHRDLEQAILAAALCALVAALVPWEIVRLAAALPLTLFLPGYAIVAAAFGSQELALPKRVTLSIGISLTVLVLGAFVLNIFPFGLRTWSWAVLLVLVVIAAARGAALRRAPARRERPRARALPGRPAASSVAFVSLALVIGIAALVLAQRPLPAKHALANTALWMLPTDSDENAVAVGVISNQHDPHSYRLEVNLGQDRSRTYRVDLDPGGERVYEIDVPPKPKARTHVVASLYRAGKPQKLYRRVTSWLPRQKTFP